ncbi:MAG: cell division protein FtsW [Clostridia bacterium]|nr:cell division protein FtsW [Clostridia bacterium]
MDNSEYRNVENNNHNRHKMDPRRRIQVQLVGGVDRPLLITIIILLCLGTVMVFSASYPYANATFNGDSYHFVKRQLLFMLLGLVAMVITMNWDKINYHFLRKISKPTLVFSIIALAGVLVFGKELNGARRWYALGPITIQPSEIVKFALVLFFADYGDKYANKISRRGEYKAVLTSVLPFVAIAGIGAGMMLVFDNKIVGAVFAAIIMLTAFVSIFVTNMKTQAPAFYYGILPYGILLGIVGVLMYMQPHLSGLIIMCGITFIMMLLSGTNAKYLVAGTVGGGGLMYLLAKTMGHSSSRLQVWEDPFSYLLEGGWQPAQSLYAIGSGGLWGVGFGNSRQKHLYLPEPQNDYIFSIWCEEMGFVGALIVILIFMFFIYRGIKIGINAPDKFSSLLVIGIISHVGLQMLLNIAVVTNSLPSTGIALPFFSYGGTSLIILLAEMGVVLSVSRYSSLENTR